MTIVGRAWQGIQRFVQDVRIDADFPRCEAEQRAAHESAASRRFDTSQLEREINKIRRAAEGEGQAAFGAQIEHFQASLEAILSAIGRLRFHLEVFTRDYRQELDQLYEEKASLLDAKRVLVEEMKALQKQRSDAQHELSEAYGDLQAAKSSIERWYAKSERTPWLFGNGGKRLPKRSLFGQSFGDLEGYKADRSRACDAIGSCKEVVAEIAAKQQANRSLRDENRNALNRVFASIRAVKEARQRMFDLKDQGVRRHRVEADLSETLQREAAIRSELDRLTSAKAELVEQQSRRMGLEERRLALADLNQQRARFLAAFDDPELQAARKRAHRQWWLKSRDRA